MSEPLVSARELADYLGVSRDTVLDWWEAGRLPGFRLGGGRGGPVRFRRSEVDATLETWRGPCQVPLTGVRSPLGQADLTEGEPA